MQSVTYENPDLKITTRYSVEYLLKSSENSTERWRRYQHVNDRGSNDEPWKLLDKEEFDDLAEAWEFYLLLLLADEMLVVNPIFEEVLINGVTAREAYIEESPSFHWNLYGVVDREMRERVNSLERLEKDKAELLGDYEKFIKEYNTQNRFSEFQKKRWEERQK